MPWNIVQCRPSTQIRQDLTEQNANGVVAAADIFLLESRRQIFFSFRNKGNLAMGFVVEIFPDYSMQIWRNAGFGWQNPVGTVAKLNLSKSHAYFI